MNRRNFLQQAAGAGVAGGLLGAAVDAACGIAARRLGASALGVAGAAWSSAASADCNVVRQPAAQLFTIRDALERDVDGALGSLAAIGIREVELFGVGASGERVFGLAPGALAAALERHGLRAPVAHLGGDYLGVGLRAELAHALGADTVVLPIAPEFMRARDGGARMTGPATLADVDGLAERLNRAGEAYRAEGLVFGYHNHHVELFELDGEVPLDRLMRATDPRLVRLELDVGWVAAAGADPVEYLRRYAGRVVACHLKDFDAAGGRPPRDAPQQEYIRRLVPPGRGAVDFERVLAAMDDAGVRHGFIEVDRSDDPFGDIAAGHEYLQGIDVC